MWARIAGNPGNVSVCKRLNSLKHKPRRSSETPRCDCRRGKEAFVLGRPGNDLLSRVLRHSTIGAEEFNGRVRDGIGFFSPRSNHRTGEGQQAREAGPPPGTLQLQGQSLSFPQLAPSGSQDPARPTGRPCSCTESQGNERSRRRLRPTITMITDSDHESNQADRAISTSQLNASPRLHIWPINVVVFHGSDREHSFQGGFPA